MNKVRTRGGRAGRSLDRLRQVRHSGSVAALRARVDELEEEVQECRQLNLRLAELIDVVQELLLPVSQRDEAKVAEILERYPEGL